jgi:hypothetical protein
LYVHKEQQQPLGQQQQPQHQHSHRNGCVHTMVKLERRSENPEASPGIS